MDHVAPAHLAHKLYFSNFSETGPRPRQPYANAKPTEERVIRFHLLLVFVIVVRHGRPNTPPCVKFFSTISHTK